MITRRYLLSTTSSRSSMGGLVMPSAVVLPATMSLPSERRGPLLDRHQPYQLPAHVLDGRVHERDIELTAGFDLGPGRFQPPGDHLGRLGAAPGEPAHELVPRRRGEEDQEGVGNLPPHL